MRVFKTRNKETEKSAMRPERHVGRGPKHPIPPHERRAMMHIEFDEKDMGILKEAFMDEDTVMAAASIIQEAPPEVQILTIQAIQLLTMIGEVTA